MIEKGHMLAILSVASICQHHTHCRYWCKTGVLQSTCILIQLFEIYVHTPSQHHLSSFYIARCHQPIPSSYKKRDTERTRAGGSDRSPCIHYSSCSTQQSKSTSNFFLHFSLTLNACKQAWIMRQKARLLAVYLHLQPTTSVVMHKAKRGAKDSR